MTSQEDSQKRSVAARSVFQRFRARAFDQGSYPSSPRPGTKIADFGVRTDQRGRQTQSPASSSPVDASPSNSDTSWRAPVGIYRSKTGTGRSRWDPQPLGDILGIEADRRGWDLTLQVASVTGDWEEIVGPHVAQHCPIESFEGGTLIARADSTAWAQQVQLLLPHIHKRIDERVGPGIVEKIVVQPPQAPSWVKGRRVFKGGRGPRDTYG